MWQVALVGVVAVDLLVADWRLNPTTDASLYRNPTVSASAVRAAGDGRVLWFADDETDIKFKHYLSFKKFGPEDAAYWLGLRETLLPNAAMIERVPTANNFDSLLVSRYNDVVTLLNKLPEADALRVSGVMDARYIISPRELPLPVVQRGADVTIYRNDAAPGRAWIVPQAKVVSDSVAALADPSFDPRQVVQISNIQYVQSQGGEQTERRGQSSPCRIPLMPLQYAPNPSRAVFWCWPTRFILAGKRLWMERRSRFCAPTTLSAPSCFHPASTSSCSATRRFHSAWVGQSAS